MSMSLKSLALVLAVATVGILSVNAAEAGNAGLRLWEKQHPGSTPPSWMFGSTRLAPSGVYYYRTSSNAVVPEPVQTVRSFSYEPGSASQEAGATTDAAPQPRSEAANPCCCPCRCSH